MGGSLGLALTSRVGATVVGFDIDADEAQVALARGCVDRLAGSLVEACVGADLVIVATPVSSIAAVIEEVIAATDASTTITDIGSTKGLVVAGLSAAEQARFVGGHPICGSEAHGAAHARAELFEKATYFLTPTLESEPERISQVHALVAAIGARPVVLAAEAHDRIVGLTSHLPHVLANVLALQVAEADVEGHSPLQTAGGSFRDMTRVAGANPAVWVDIFLANRAAVLAALEETRARLDRVSKALAEGDAPFLSSWITQAGSARNEALALAHRASPADLHELIVSVSDRRGAISSIAQTLSAASINIEEFSLSHISPESGGEIRIVIAGDAQASQAVELLRADGCTASRDAVLDDALGGSE